MSIEVPAPEFTIGQTIRVVKNTPSNTQRIGIVREAIWHYKNGCYNYYIEMNAKRISKRYSAKDLEACP